MYYGAMGVTVSEKTPFEGKSAQTRSRRAAGTEPAPANIIFREPETAEAGPAPFFDPEAR